MRGKLYGILVFVSLFFRRIELGFLVECVICFLDGPLRHKMEEARVGRGYRGLWGYPP